ncbi:MAG: cytosol nonspecific dipeptidase [Bacteroidetes bacterium HGW-Bacteroidetes-6]|jgi:dipeptidase D|nr:MAG: cytosol nonspecific dipeptidase [Bacteroidetes bacterium HGW-Bacteroidetes-6]
MSQDIKNLEPKEVWTYFHELTQIPRPSKHEEAIRAYMVNFGKSLGLETIEDKVGNVIIRKPATPGMENRKGIVLQGHLDMVPQKNSDKVFDFLKDPIEAFVDGEWVTANGTTLGADNGMGVAAAMAVLASKTIKHGPVEALMTIDEETGMTGAFGLESNVLKADILINLDSEDEGEMYVGCAGGIDANITMNYTTMPVPAGHKAYKLSLTGLKGGHSGMEIILGRGNANKLMNRFIQHAVEKHDMMVASIHGGSLRNAIPRESFAVVTIPENRITEFTECVKKMDGIFHHELSAVEPEFTFIATPEVMPESVIDPQVIWKLVRAIYACPNGVIRMSDAMENLVETSNNLASIDTDNGVISIKCLLRSSVDSAKEDLGYAVSAAFELADANVNLDGGYPGWKPNMDSAILKSCREMYQGMYGKIPEIKAIHAGLECGLLGAVYPNWDMISFGPTIRYPHSPDEKVNIASVQKFYDFLVKVLENAPMK